MSTITITVNGLDSFFHQNTGFDILTFNLGDETELAKLNWQGLERAKVLELLKKYQRLLRLYPNDPTVAQALLTPPTGQAMSTEGGSPPKVLDSAHAIAALGEATFVKDYGTHIGGAAIAREVYRNAKSVVARTTLLWANVHNLLGSPHFRSMRVNNMGADIQESFENSPNYQELFGSLDYYECEDCHSIFSPAAYFVDLKRIIDENITAKKTINDLYQLDKRRPDLDRILLTCANTTDLAPYLDIVNNALAESLKAQLNNQDPFQFLATATYPFNLPFNLPLEQIRSYLGQLNVDLANIYKIFNVKDSYVARESLKLSVEEYNLITTSTPPLNDLNNFYGVTDISSDTSIGSLSNLDKFLRQTGLSRHEVEDLFYQNLSQDELKNNLARHFYINQVLSDGYLQIASTESASDTIKNLSLTTLDRINRFVRLAKKLNWSFADLDWVLTSIGVTATQDINGEAIQKIAAIKQLQTRLNLPLDVLCSLWYDIKTYGVGDAESSQARFDIVFNNPQLLGKQAPYHPTYSSNSGYGDTALKADTGNSRIAAGLQISLDDLSTLINALWSSQNKSDGFTIANLSVLYRHSTLAAVLGLPIPSYLLLLRLLNKNKPSFEIQDVLDILDSVSWLANTGLNIYELDYILNDNDSKYVDKKYKEENILPFLQSLWALSISPQPDLKVNDILDWGGFISKICSERGQTSPSNLLWKVFSSEVQTAVTSAGTLTEDMKLEIVSALNTNILPSSVFYTLADFSNVEIPEQVKQLLTLPAVRSQNQTKKLNRLLLEASYPQEIAKGNINQIGDEWKHKLLEHLAVFLGSTTDIVEALMELIAGKLTLPAKVVSYVDVFVTPSPNPQEDFPNLGYIKQAIRELSRLLVLNQKLLLSQAEIDSIRTTPAAYGIATDFSKFDLENLRILYTFKQLTAAFNDTQNELIQYFADSSPSNDKLAAISGWQSVQINSLAKASASTNPPNTVAEIASFKQVFDLCNRMGVNISFCLQAVSLANTSADSLPHENDITNWDKYTDLAQSIIEIVKAKYNDDDWSKVSEAIAGSLDELKRNALTGFVLWKLNQQDNSIQTLRNLSEYLLIDVETSGAVSISPIKQGILSLQMYLQRCRMNLEPGVTLTHEDIPETCWEWIMNYRIWEANRKVFLYPENYIEPNLRKNKSDLFAELESELLQSDITQDAVADAYNNYFDKLAELAKLRIVETYRCFVEQPDSAEPVDTLFVFGRTATEPATYYYRKCINPTATKPTWTPWSKIDLSINADYISPVFAFNKLFIFWVEIVQTKTNSSDTTKKHNVTKATIKFTFQTVSQKWVQPQTLAKDIVISSQDISNQDDTSQLLQNLDPFWEKVYSIPVSENGVNSDKALIVYGGNTAPVGNTSLLPYTFTLTSDLSTENSSLVSKDVKDIDALFDNYADLSDAAMVSYWPLDDNAATISDKSGNNNGTLVDGIWPSQQTKPAFSVNPRYLLGFDGSKSYVHCDNKPSLNPRSQSWTVACWFNFNATSNSAGTIFCKDGVYEGLIIHGDQGDQGYYFQYALGNDWQYTGDKSFPVDSGKWYHVAVAFDGQRQYLYCNGSLVFSRDRAGILGTNESNFLIGAKYDLSRNPAVFFNGSIAEVCIWNTALNGEQIYRFANRNSGRSPFHSQIHPSGNNSILAVKNQPEWFTFDSDKEAFLVVPQQGANSYSPSLAVQDDGTGALEVSYSTPTEQPDKLAFTRLTTSTIHQLSQKAFIGGIDRLLSLDSQLTPELDFSRFNPSNTVIPPASRTLDFSGSYGLYFQEIFFHIPFLVANALNANQRFAEAQQWYHYIFNPTQPPLPKPLAYWPLNEGTGKNITDKSGNGNTGTLGVPSDSNPNWLTATDFPTGSRSVLQFDGKSNYVDCGGKVNPVSQSWTVACWFKCDKTDGENILFNKDAEYEGEVREGYFVYAFQYDTSGTGWNWRGGSSFQVEVGKWYHVAVVYDGETEYLYKNGSLVFSSPQTGSINATGIYPFVIGARHNLSSDLSDYFQGQIAEVCIWNVALSPTQIAECVTASDLNNLCDRYWRYLPFRGQTIEKLKDILTDSQAIQAYNDDPFDPHAIANLRFGTYQKAIVMKYIDNLLDWGDSLFAQDTWEAITQATMLYLLAYDLLGPKPEDLGKQNSPLPKTFLDIKNKYHDDIPQFLIDLEQQIAATASLLAQTPFNDINAYFCVSENAQFTAYWDRVEDRLYKIRHSENIAGVVRQLALYEPPIDPMQIVRAVASGNVPISVVSGLSANVPNYRFDYMLERAKNITSTLIQLGASLLSALEKQDAEQLSLLRATQEPALLRLIQTTKEKQITEAQANVDSLNKSLGAATNRANHYQNLISGGLSPHERDSQNLFIAGLSFESSAAIANTLASPAYLVPNIAGLAVGGMNFGAAIATIGAASSGIANTLNQGSSLAATMGQYSRRTEDWQLQLQMAQDDVALISQQIAASQINTDIATAELNAHLKSIEQADDVENFYQNKFTTSDLYQWMVARLSTLYFQTFKIALSMALSAQTAYQYELNQDDTYISFDYWDSLKKGLLAGEGLMLGLNQLEKAYIEGNVRTLEIEKTISLSQLNSLSQTQSYKNAFDQLQKTGECQFELNEKLFDSDFPGHYCRQIKTISISIPAVIGPYQNIKATLTQLSDKLLIEPKSDAVKYLLDQQGSTQPDTSILRSSWRRNQKIALSRGVNDSGLFELNFKDERYLPFEGTGAVSTWELSLPQKANPNIDFTNLTDVIINLSYTALDAGDSKFKKTVSGIVYSS